MKIEESIVGQMSGMTDCAAVVTGALPPCPSGSSFAPVSFQFNSNLIPVLFQFCSNFVPVSFQFRSSFVPGGLGPQTSRRPDRNWQGGDLTSRNVDPVGPGIGVVPQRV
jgi:hypothetical protein